MTTASTTALFTTMVSTLLDHLFAAFTVLVPVTIGVAVLFWGIRWIISKVRG